jgi:tRNA threonylcarbamoyladenosine biosynthesis protein TsaE
MNNTYITKNGKQTRLLGEKFAKNLKPGDVLAFYGNLGSGKTTFIQGLAKGLGVNRRVISPTFIIVRHYKIEKGNFYHIDLYRTETENDLIGLGIDEIIIDKENINAFEWAEKLGKLLPKKRIDINCKYVSENEREITIEKHE